jgi:hypothetical protein
MPYKPGTTDLNDAEVPEQVIEILYVAARKFRDNVPELQAAWQDMQAGEIWDKVADSLEVAARNLQRKL